MMIISDQMKALLSKRLLEKPLGDTEVRRMTGMGELYATKPGVQPQEDGFRFRRQYTLEIGGEDYDFHARYHDDADE